MKKKTSCQLLAAVMSVLLLAGCNQAAPEPEEVRLSLGFSGAATSEQVVTVAVTQDRINTVQPGIFGANVAWAGDGFGLWDTEAGAPDEKLLEKLKNSGVAHIRYPGGIEGDYFHWYEAVGENRVPQIDPFSQYWPNDDGYDGAAHVVTFGPDELLALCRAAGDGMTIQLNAGNGTPQEAADWVRHCLEQGADVWSFCVGNEVCMDEERVEGITVTCTPKEYVEFYNAVYEELGDLVDGLEFGAIGITPSHKLCKYRDWDYTVLTELGDKIDFIDVHIGYTTYFVDDGVSDEELTQCILASSQYVRKLLDEEIGLINTYAKGDPDGISIQITEWGPWVGDEDSTSVAASLYMATFLNTVLAEPKVSAADYAHLIRHYLSPNLIGALEDTSIAAEEVYWDNCNSYVFRWYAEQIGRSVLNAAASGGKTFDSIAVGLIPAIQGVMEGEASVYYDPDTGKGTLFLINKSCDENTVFDLEMPFERFTVDAITEMWNEDSFASNSYKHPNDVVPASYEAGMTVTDGRLQVEAKPVSILKIDFTAAN